MSSFPALVIGVEEYDLGDSLPEVRFDVATVSSALRRIGYTVTSHPSIRAQRSTRARLMRLITRFSLLVRAAGGGILYFSGKGMAKKVGRQHEPGICPSDVVTGGPILLSELNSLFGGAAPNVVLVLDCGMTGEKSYGSGLEAADAISSMPLLSAPRYSAKASLVPHRGSPFTKAFVKALAEVTPISQASQTAHSVGVSVAGLAEAVSGILSAGQSTSGNPGVEIDGSTNGVYTIKTQSAPKSLVVLPPGPFLPGLNPTGFATGVEYWPEGFAWPSSFVIERAQTVPELSASGTERYQWQTFPASTSQYPHIIPSGRWRLTLETKADNPQTIGHGFLCRSADGEYLLWFADDDAIAPGGNVLRVGYSAAHGADLRLLLTTTTAPITPGMRWVRCDRVA